MTDGGWCAPPQPLCLCGAVLDEDNEHVCSCSLLNDSPPPTRLLDVRGAVVWAGGTEFELRPGAADGMALEWNEDGQFWLDQAKAIGHLAQGLGLPRSLLEDVPPLIHHWADWADYGRWYWPVAGRHADRYTWCPGDHLTREHATHLVKTRPPAGRWRWCVCQWCAPALVQALTSNGVAAAAYRYRRTPVRPRKPSG